MLSIHPTGLHSNGAWYPMGLWIRSSPEVKTEIPLVVAEPRSVVQRRRGGVLSAAGAGARNALGHGAHAGLFGGDLAHGAWGRRDDARGEAPRRLAGAGRGAGPERGPGSNSGRRRRRQSTTGLIWLNRSTAS